MKRFLIMGVALSAMIAAPVMAAEMRPPRPPVYAPLPPPVIFTWTGCYIGGHGGGLIVQKEWFNADVLDPDLGKSVGSHDATGWLAGVQAGCDLQLGEFVVGIQSDFAWADAKGSNTNLLDSLVTNHSRVRSVGSVTARLGFAWDQFLGYVKGGGAWEHDEYDFSLDGAIFASAEDKRRFGWTVGVGGEFAFLDWLSAFIEYDYFDFGTRDLQFAPTLFATEIEERKHVLKGGINLRFGWGTAGYW